MKKGSKYINKDGVNKAVPEELLNKYLSDGWSLGNTNANTGGGSKTSGLKYFNNGCVEVRRKECPEGFVPGRLPFSDEHKNKIGESNHKSLLGKSQAKETIRKRQKSLVGHPTSEETKKKISNSLAGRKTKSAGKHWYTDGKVSILSERCPEGFRPGKIVSDETRKKISKKQKGRKSNNKETSTQKRMATNLRKYGVEWPMFLGEKRGNKRDSTCNVEFKELLESRGIEFTREFRCDNFFFDFKVGRRLIEIDPYPTHNINWNPYNNRPIDKDYHLKKTVCAENSGYMCIHVFDWDDKNKIISLLQNRDTVYARNCSIKEISNRAAKEFLDKNHLQGYCRSSLRYGLFFKDELVSVMTFGKPRYNKNVEWELLRYCSTKNVIGGAEKLFAMFLTEKCPKSILSYCDISKFSGGTYERLGFKEVSLSAPTRHWYNFKQGIHITDNLLRQRGFDQLFNSNYGKGSSNDDLMRSHGFVEIYDCGQKTFVWEMK